MDKCGSWVWPAPWIVYVDVWGSRNGVVWVEGSPGDDRFSHNFVLSPYHGRHSRSKQWWNRIDERQRNGTLSAGCVGLSSRWNTIRYLLVDSAGQCGKNRWVYDGCLSKLAQRDRERFRHKGSLTKPTYWPWTFPFRTLFLFFFFIPSQWQFIVLWIITVNLEWYFIRRSSRPKLILNKETSVSTAWQYRAAISTALQLQHETGEVREVRLGHRVRCCSVYSVVHSRRIISNHDAPSLMIIPVLEWSKEFGWSLKKKLDQ